MKQPDYTFWTRLDSHLKDIQCNDAWGYEEVEYFKYVVKQQLRQQYENAKGEELEYLDRLKTKDKL